MLNYKQLKRLFSGGHKMQILKFQTAVFFRTPAERPDLLHANMPPALLELFDRIPIIPPMPPIPIGIPNPPDLPIVTLQSSHMGYQGTISKNRADLFYNYTSHKNYSELLDEISEYSKWFFQYFCAKQQVNRLGIVMSAFLPEENAVKTLAKKYSTRELQNCEELAIRFNKRGQTEGIQLNNIISLHSDDVTFGEQAPVSGVIVECDINNVPQPIVLTEAQCKTIFRFAIDSYKAEEVKKLIL